MEREYKPISPNNRKTTLVKGSCGAMKFGDGLGLRIVNGKYRNEYAAITWNCLEMFETA